MPSPESVVRALRVALVGHHEKDYPRNQAIRVALSTAGFEVTECHSRAPFPWRHFVLAWKYFRIHRHVDILLVTEGGHRLVPLMRLWAAMTGKKLVFDPFLSRYNTRVEDRRLHKPGSLQARICAWQDWSSTHAADALIFDTHEHKEYFYKRYNLKKPFAVIPVGVDETLFRPDAFAAPAEKPPFEVLFYGTYIPLQGIEYVLEAAALLEAEDANIRFRLIGTGQTHEAMRARARELGLRRVDFEPPVPAAGLPARIARASVCLGIFGTTLKAGNVVPNKVVQAAAMGAALITADTPAVRRYFRDEDALMIPPGDSRALANAILTLKAHPERAMALGRGARHVFLTHFAIAKQADTLGRFLREILALPRF